MSLDPIDRLVAGSFVDPESGATLSVPTRRVLIEKTLKGAEVELLRSLDFGHRLGVVCDGNTRAVLGQRVERALAGHYALNVIELPGIPHADAGTVERIRKASPDSDALLAVGSGTINDLCKYASALAGIPYAVFATAPSMNGYTSVNAAITVEGHKKSLQAHGAAGVFMDLEVLCAAPRRMVLSGLGDSVCRPTAQADWLLSHMLLDTAYRETPFVLLAEDEAALLAEPEALVGGDLEVMQRLARTLTLSGFGMTICGSSAPASQGEHMISHLIEMLPPPGWDSVFHGEQIAVTTLTMARLQEALLSDTPPRLSATGITREDVAGAFGEPLGKSCWDEFQHKHLNAQRADTLNGRLESRWDEIRTRIAKVSQSSSTLTQCLARAGAPTTPQQIGLTRPHYDNAVLWARTTRNRFSFLDLASDSGLLSAETVSRY